MGKKNNLLRKNALAVLITIFVLVIALVPEYGQAVIVQSLTDKTDYNAMADVNVTFNVSINIESGEFVPVQYIDLKINDTVKRCQFYVNGTAKAYCNNMHIYPITTTGTNGIGYGYGPDTTGTYDTTNFGYGYGFDDQNIPGGELRYRIVWTVPYSFKNGNYQAKASAYAKGDTGSEYTYGQTSTTGFVLDKPYVAQAKSELDATDIKNNNVDLNNVVSDLNLITNGGYGTLINWSSSNTAYVTKAGVVTRPASSTINAGVSVRLHYTITKAGSPKQTGYFDVYVLKEAKSDQTSVDDATFTFNDIKLSNTDNTNVTGDLDLFKTWTDGTTVSWTSSKPGTVSTLGTVSRQSTDVGVNLVATISKGTATAKTISFNVIVKGTNGNLLIAEQAKSSLLDARVLNGNIDVDHVAARLKFPRNLSAYPGVRINWTSANPGVIKITGNVTRPAAPTTVEVNATFYAGTGAQTQSTTKRYVFTVLPKPGTTTTPNAVVEEDQTEIVVGTAVETISIPQTVQVDEVIVLNYEEEVVSTATEVTLSLENNLTLTRETSADDYSIELPNDLEIVGPADWNGIINVPTVEDAGDYGASNAGDTVDAVVEVGFGSIRLNLSKPARIILSGMSGKTPGFTYSSDDTMTKITTECASATDFTGIPANGECYYDDGNDLFVWTYHFSKYGAMSSSTTTTSSGSSGGSGTLEDPNNHLNDTQIGDEQPAGIPIQIKGAVGAENTSTTEDKTNNTTTENKTTSETTGDSTDKNVGTEDVIPPTDDTGKVDNTPTVKEPSNGAEQLLIIILLLVILGLVMFDRGQGGLPWEDHITRARKVHKRAESAHRKGKHHKAKKLYHKAEHLRSKAHK